MTNEVLVEFPHVVGRVLFVMSELTILNSLLVIRDVCRAVFVRRIGVGPPLKD